MAIIACPECANEISDKAAACPHCGNPMKETPEAVVVVRDQPAPKGEGCFLQTMNLGCAIMFILLGIVVFAAIMSGSKG